MSGELLLGPAVLLLQVPTMDLLRCLSKQIVAERLKAIHTSGAGLVYCEMITITHYTTTS